MSRTTTTEAFVAAFGTNPAPRHSAQPHSEEEFTEEVGISSAGAESFRALSVDEQLEELEKLARALLKAQAELVALRKGGK